MGAKHSLVLFPKKSEVPSLFSGENARKLWQNNSPIAPTTSTSASTKTVTTVSAKVTSTHNSIFGRTAPAGSEKVDDSKSSNGKIVAGAGGVDNAKQVMTSIFSDQFSGSWNN